MKSKIVLIVVGIAVLFAVACGSEPTPAGPTATPIPPTPTPDPAAIVREAGAAMTGLESVQFEIQRSGGPASIDPDGLLVLNQASGRYAAPDSIAAVIDVAGPGLNIQVETVAIGEEQWLTNFLNQQWEKLPPGFGFNPAVIFSDSAGLESILDEDVQEVSPLRSEELDGQTFQVVDVTVEGAQVQAVTANAAASDQPVTLTLWIDPSTQYIHQIRFETPSRSEEPSQWLLRFSGFNEPVTIEPPI